MNKIYKVVWSKVKHCYVVTSELAKRNGKGCGARSLRMAAVSMGVAAALIGGVGFGSPVAEAADPVISGSVTKGGTTKNFTQANFTYESGGTTYQNDYGYGNGFFDGESETAPTTAQGYTVNITSAPNWRFFVGAGVPYGTVSGNSVTVNGDSTNITQEVIGGYAYGEETGTKTSTVTNNSVTVNGGTLASVSGANMGGYWAAPGTASDNTVTINAGLIKGDIRGAFGYDKAEENKVYIKGGTVDFYNDSFSVTGGESGTGTASNNEVIISDGTAGNENGGGIRGGMSWRGQANENKVTISGGTVKGAVYGGMNSTLTGRTIYSGDTPEEHTPLTGTVSQNGVIISAGTVTGKIYGGLGAVSASGNTVTIKDNAKVEEGSAVYGGSAMAKYVTNNFVFEPSFHIDETVDKVEYGTVTGNTINIEDSASVTGEIAGGYGAGGDNKENKVYVKGGTVTGSVYGARLNSTESTTGNATANEVHISKGSVTGDVYGGAIKENVTGEVKGNKVEITGGIINEGHEVHGGHSLYNSVGGTGENDGNKVIISGGEVHCNVVGGFSFNKSAIGNSVEISGGKVGPTSNTAYIYGGYSFKGAVTDNKVSINSGTIGEGKNAYVYGGYADQGAADTNEVNLNGGKIGKFSYVSYIFGGRGKTSASGNTVNITGGAFENGSLYGGYSSTGTADTNIISMTGGTLSNTSIHGGRSGASASGNEVTVSGGLAGYVYGGAATYNTGKMNQNKVTVTGEETVVSGVIGGQDGVENNDNTVLIEDGSTVKVDVYGGYSTGAGSAINNKVTVTDSTVNGNVFGGVSFRGAEAVTKNAVTINNSTIGKNVYGGRQYDNESGTAFSVTGNIVTINGGTFSADKKIYGGFTYSGTTTDNIINLTGTTTGLEGVEIYGGSQSANTGNELHVGGTKTYDTSGNFVTNSGDVWQGSSNNTVKKVANFEKIVLHSVKWDKDVAVLDAATVTNIGTLNIKNMQFDKTPSNSESMALLKSGSDLSAVTLTYSGGTKLIPAEGVTIKEGSGEHTEETGVNGVKLTTKGGSEKVLMPDKNTIAYSFEPGTVKGITFGTFDSGKEARDLSGSKFEEGNTIDAAGLSFSNTASLLKKNDAITLVSKATGMVTSVTNGTGKTIGSDFTDDNKIQFTTEAKGDVTSTGTEVKYTVTDVTLKKVDLTNWNGTTSYMSSQTAGWTLKAGETVATGDLAKADLSDLKPGDTKPILTAGDSVKFTNDAIAGNKKWQAGGEIIDTAVNGVKIEGTTTGGGVKVDDNKSNQLVYQQSKDNVTKVTLSEVPYTKEGTARPFGNAYDLTNAGIDATAFKLSNLDDVKASMKTGDTMVIVDAAKAIANAKGETLKGFTATPEPISVDFKDEKVDGKELTFEGTHKDTLSLNDKKTQVVYKVGEKEVNKATFTGEVAWNDSEAYYDAEKGKEKYQFATTDIDTTNLKVTGKTDKALKKGDAMTLISATGLKAGKVTQPTDAGSIDMNYSEKGITLAGKVAGEVKAADNAIKYEVTGVNVNKADIGSVEWQEGASLVDFSDKANNFAGVTTIGTDKFAMTYAKPEEVAAKQSMTLLKANDSLQAIVNEEKAKTYSIEPVAGVTIDAKLTGKLANSGNNVTFTATENKASALTFEKVEWTGSNPLIDHSKTLANVSFDGATVDTSNIDFYKEMYIEADQTTTLVSDFGGTPKDIKGTTYKVGTAFDGEGSATMENGNLVFRTKTSAGVSEQTHKAVMGVEATMGLLASGIGHLDKVLDGFGNVSNAGSDGASTSASIGGGKDRYETNSHVNINSWSAAVGVGARKETKKGTLQYGIFGEYGKGNYTMHSDVGRSDGDAHYAGGGLMAKWTNKHDVYTEASFRLGRVSDTANDLLRDGAGNAYGYDIHATYYGAHVGLGKIFNYKGGKSLDVYGKFFYTKRDGCEFDAKQHYNLDSVNSSVLRIGARYGTTDKKWNWYGGLAYEYEFDGEAKGTVNGTEIRAASIKGSSVRGEFGMRMDATKDNPWRTDISIYGYGGKHRGFGGSVNVAYMF